MEVERQKVMRAGEEGHAGLTQFDRVFVRADLVVGSLPRL